jgi:FixJ family two-component response regulator
MPGMTGLEIQRHLGAQGVRFPTVLFTADDTPEVQARYLTAGVAEYLRKPVLGEELLAAIERAVEAQNRRA